VTPLHRAARDGRPGSCPEGATRMLERAGGSLDVEECRSVAFATELYKLRAWRENVCCCWVLFCTQK
jgi:hypothetical protein